jgi:hypothetical protein
MKRIYISLFFGLLMTAISVQAPQDIANQAVIRNSNNELMANAAIAIKGNAVYVETLSIKEVA